ncbi:MAG: hypothetical protein ACFFA6_15810, partial [Promethearchaeota archaeon]
SNIIVSESVFRNLKIDACSNVSLQDLIIRKKLSILSGENISISKCNINTILKNKMLNLQIESSKIKSQKIIQD